MKVAPVATDDGGSVRTNRFEAGLGVTVTVADVTDGRPGLDASMV